MKKPLFTGACTALVTPFAQGRINLTMLQILLQRQMDAGIGAVVLCGTTGESPTLSDEEKILMFHQGKKYAASGCTIIAGTGSNDTAYALELTKYACEVGVDGVLVVTPYYNKATQKGLIKMFESIADNSTSPVILYNVPSRTGVNIEPSTYKALADHENIVAIKEANGNISKIVETMSLVEGKLDLYSGNDDQIVPLMAMGGIGAISVLSNLLPRKTKEITTNFFNGNIKESAKLQCELHALIDALFCEVNPIPVKAAMAHMGYCENYLRLPLTTMDEVKCEKMLQLMRAQGLKV